MSRDITQNDRDNAARLKAIWQARKKDLGLTQTAAAKRLGYKSQGVVAQYLNGHIALNPKAIIGFANLLRCEPGDIDPSLGKLHITKAASHHEVKVVGTLSGEGAPSVSSVEVRYATMPHRCLAFEVDSDQYLAFKRGSVLVTSPAEEPVADDDVLITLTNGARVIATYLGGDNAELHVVDALTGQEDRYALNDVRTIDPIVEIVRPRVKRPTRIRAVT